MKKYIYIMLFLFFIAASPRALAESYLIGTNPDNISLFSALDAEPVAPSVGVYSTDDKEYAEQLLAEGKISYIEKSSYVELFSFEQDPLYALQWNLQKCGFPKARAYTRGKNDVLVAVIDSGIEPNHPDFGDNILPGYCTASGASDTADTTDTVGHGTAVAGIIGALAYNGEGVAGIADNVQILPIQFTKTGYNEPTESLLKAIEYALDQHCDIINISAGTANYSNSLRLLMQRAYEENVIVVSAVGNAGTNCTDGSDYLNYPAAFDTVVGVGATDKNDIITKFSQKNNSVNVCVPGVELVMPISYKYSTNTATQLYSGYGKSQGTSFACPQVAAAAALARSVKPDLTPTEFLSLISETSTDLGPAGYDPSYGYGLLNIEAILDRLNPELSKTNVVTIELKTNGANTLSVINNNTALPLKAQSIIAFFSADDSFAAPPEIESVEIPPNSMAEKTVLIPSGSKARSFLWDDLNSLIPISFPTNTVFVE